MIEHLLRYGEPAGRRAAVEALAEFNGAEANALVIKVLEDPDPAVQAMAVEQSAPPRDTGRDDAAARSCWRVHHLAVRRRKSLAEFTFKRFVGAFDMLDEEVRRSTGLLVKKIDPQAIPQLRLELHSRSRTRRLRAAAISRG